MSRIALVLSDRDAAVLRRALVRVQRSRLSMSDMGHLLRVERKLRDAMNGAGQAYPAVIENLAGLPARSVKVTLPTKDKDR